MSRWQIAGAITLFALFLLVPVPSNPRWQICAFHWLTGRPCPLCGLTRAIFALAKGHWKEAISFNALSPLGFVMLFSLFWRTSWRPRLWTFGIAAFGIYGVWRAILFK